jgi:GAF domain-containing protein
MRAICQVIVDIGGYRLAWVGFAEQDETKTVRPVAQAGYEEGYLETVNITWADTERGRGPTGTAIRTGQPSVMRDILTDPIYEPWRVDATRRGYSSSIALPLTGDEQVIGVLNIYAEESDTFDEQEIVLLMELASDLSYGIEALRARAERKQAEEAIRKLNEELEERVAARTQELTEVNAQLSIFRRLADASGQGFSILTLAGEITYANSSLCRLFGEEPRFTWPTWCSTSPNASRRRRR